MWPCISFEGSRWTIWATQYMWWTFSFISVQVLRWCWWWWWWSKRLWWRWLRSFEMKFDSCNFTKNRTTLLCFYCIFFNCKNDMFYKVSAQLWYLENDIAILHFKNVYFWLDTITNILTLSLLGGRGPSDGLREVEAALHELHHLLHRPPMPPSSRWWSSSTLSQPLLL